VCRVNNITDLGIEKCPIVSVLLRQIPTSFIDINDKSTVIVTVGLSFLFRNKYQTFMQNLVGAAEGGSVVLWSGKYYEHKIGKELRIRLIDFVILVLSFLLL